MWPLWTLSLTIYQSIQKSSDLIRKKGQPNSLLGGFFTELHGRGLLGGGGGEGGAGGGSGAGGGGGCIYCRSEG